MESNEKMMVINCASALAKFCMDLEAESAETTIIRDGKVVNIALTVEIDDIQAQ